VDEGFTVREVRTLMGGHSDAMRPSAGGAA
jgi:hypothetical protein